MLIIFISWPGLAASAPLNTDAPRLANIFLHWSVADDKARDLAEWDVVILDMDIQTSNPSAIDTMRRINPDIKIFAYIPLVEVRQSIDGLASSSLRRKLAQGIKNEWYLVDTSGNKRSFWQGNWIMNITNECLSVAGQRWNDYLPSFVKNEIIASGKWDGVFFDNGWEDVTYFAGGNLDFNRDGQPAGSSDANRLWKEGIAKALDATASAIGSKYLVMLNDGPYYANHTDGVTVENFSSKDWTYALKNYRDAVTESQQPSSNILNSNTNNTGSQNDYKTMRFGYTSAMLFDGYYSFDFGDQDHGQTWWYDEYGAYLGAPKGPAENLTSSGSDLMEGLWKREFQNGLVLVNSTYSNQSTEFFGEYEKIHGVQDPKKNDGSIVSGTVVAPRDGIVLIRPIEKIANTTFTNGSFVRIFNRYGEVYRTGFFAYEADYRGGSNVAIADLNSDGQDETVVGDINRVTIYDASGKVHAQFYPYTDKYRGGINITAGDLDKDGFMEIVTGTENGGGPQIRIFNRDGVLINPGFFAYDKNFRGGVNVTIGDLNGDGWKEIIAGAGVGGGPHVRVFGLDGRLINPGFFAYDKNFRGGVNVAAGDTDGDGADEIITGPGLGGGPHVRVFNEKGQALDGGGFFAYDVHDNSGVGVAATDIDNDGRDEIIAETTGVFTLSMIK
ncbi:MAG: putative glycoside hydrolase [Patescibacteria group bacterium]|nr:putative glycoside hydrolase [Patescibacteria group bacterium]